MKVLTSQSTMAPSTPHAGAVPLDHMRMPVPRQSSSGDAPPRAGTARAPPIEPRMLVAGLDGPRQACAHVVENVIGSAVAVVVGFRRAVARTWDTRRRTGSGIGLFAGVWVRLAREAPAVLNGTLGTIERVNGRAAQRLSAGRRVLRRAP